MLFWRTHRAARIVFSLSFHLGEMTPQEAIDCLVERVGRERDNATAEIRRSFGGDYPPSIRPPTCWAACSCGRLTGQALSRDFESNWKFYGPDPIGDNP
jgi:hypothetical protein